MEEEQEKKQKEINVIALMKNPEEFRKTFEELKKMAALHLQSQQFEAAIDSYLKCIDMLDLGKNIISALSPVTRACLYANLAAAYQGAWKIQKCNKYCQKAQEELSKIINESDNERFLKIAKFLVTLKFQHCAILSQLNQHEKALETCKSTLPTLDKAVSIINGFSKKQEESFNDKFSDEGVIFSRKVYGFAGQILSTLGQQLSASIEMKQSKSSSFYFWERNPQKNEEQLKKTFLPQNNSNSRRSILGVNKQSHWVDEFNIGSIMRMQEMKAQNFEKVIPMEEYLFKEKLFQLVIHCSLAFFTIATEMRFIDSQKNGELQEMKSQKEMSVLQTIKKKYGYEEKSQTFRLSEAYHLRSIQIISANIQSPIPYLTHMIKSYEKHYVFKKKLEEIVAINDESVVDGSSIMNPSNLNSKQNQKNSTDGDYGNEIAVINRQTTEEDFFENYNDYHNQTHEQKDSKKEEQWKPNPREKGVRNTVKMFHSQAKDQLKDRAKSVGKLRKNPQKQTKQEQTERCIQNLTSPPKPKKKKNKERETFKEQRFKKTRLKLGENEVEGELHVKTKSSTHFKFVFKKKKDK